MHDDPRFEGWRPGPRSGHGHTHRHHGPFAAFGPGPGGPGPGPGPGFGPGFGPGPGFGFGFGPGFDPAARHRRRGWGRGRVPRGDVRAAVLLLLAEQPMHGYQLMHAIGERSGGRWTPSPGAIYPTLAQLEDEGLVTVTAEAGRKLATLTDAGRAAVEELRTAGTDPFAGAAAGAPGADLRGLLDELHGAVRQVARTGTEAQLTAAADVLAQARRALYLLLAEGPDSPPPPAAE
ncbi:PadR family transcriptional regulator [Geodermatophilus sp. SYSU D00814]